MADSASGDAIKVDYLHPEILPTDILLGILKERKICESELDCADKYKLVELYYNHVIPLPQRIYGHGRRQIRLAKYRDSRESLKRKNESGTDTEDEKSKKVCNVGSNSSKCASRLKPPPSDRNEGKILKLTTSGSSESHSLNNNSSIEDKVSNINISTGVSPTRKRKFQPISWP